jgi:hypothetical protein
VLEVMRQTDEERRNNLESEAIHRFSGKLHAHRVYESLSAADIIITWSKCTSRRVPAEIPE